MKEIFCLLICVPTLVLGQSSIEARGRLNQSLAEKNCPEFARLFEQKMKLYPPKMGGRRFVEATGGQFDDAWELNVGAWEVFERCDDESTLSKALKWSELSIELAPGSNVQSMDTRANLLYKMRRLQEAIAAEEGALEEDTRLGQKEGKEKGALHDVFVATIKKMKVGEPTWPRS